MTSRLTVTNVDEDIDSSVSVLEGFPNSRVSSTVHTLKSSARVPEDASFQPLKRRRAVGINSRYDNMIDQVRMLSGHRASSTSSRRRVYSSGSSSLSDVPKTPLSAYSGIQEGRLGKNFTLIKMKRPAAQSSSPSQTGNYLKTGFARIQDDTTSISLPPMPDWLNETLLGLRASHPLRRLMPTTTGPLPAEPPFVEEFQGHYPNQNEIGDDDASVFAFQPPRLGSLPLAGSDPTAARIYADPNTDVAAEFASDNLPEFSVHTADLLLVPDLNADYDYTVRGPDALPFSTPGPASYVSVAQHFDARPAQVSSDDISRAFSHPGPASTLSSVLPQLEESGKQYPTLLARSPVMSSSPFNFDTPPFLFKHLPAYVNSPSPSPPPSTTQRDHHVKQDVSLSTALHISNPFSTPGPTHRKSSYTSSSPSSAIQNDFVGQVDVDPESLDFHWAPFIRDHLVVLQDGITEGDSNYSATAHSRFQLRPKLGGNQESSDIYSPVNNEYYHSRSGSDNHLPARSPPTQNPNSEQQHSFYHHKWTGSGGAGPEVYSLEPNTHIDERHSDKVPSEGQLPPSTSTSNTEEFDWEVLPPSSRQPVGRASPLLPISETRATHLPDPRPPLGAFAPAPGIFVSPLRAPGCTGSRKPSEDRGIQPLRRRTQASASSEPGNKYMMPKPGFVMDNTSIPTER